VPWSPLRVPPTRDFPTIRRSLLFYKVFAYATGTFLLLVCAEVVLRYVFGSEVVLGGALGAVALVSPEQVHAVGGVNLSLGILITHGYLFIAYLISDFVLITVMRYPITRFILIGLGGVIPALSFIMEAKVEGEVRSYLSDRERKLAAAPA
jgi:integral membrane protein